MSDLADVLRLGPLSGPRSRAGSTTFLSLRSRLAHRMLMEVANQRPARRRRRRSLIHEPLERRDLLAANLLAAWQADDLTASVQDAEAIVEWHDSVGGVTATANGAPRLATDVLDGHAAVRFSRSDGADSLTVPAASNPLAGAEDFSVVVAFATESTALNGGQAAWFLNTGLVDATDFFGTTADWGLVITSTGAIGAGLGGPAQSLYSNTNGFNDGLIHVAAMTRSGGTLSVYVDGRLAGTTSSASTAPRIATDITFGAVSRNSQAYTGDIAEIRFYDNDLTAEEVHQDTIELLRRYSFVQPLTEPDHYTIDEDNVLDVDAATGVLSNDLNVEPTPQTASLLDGPSHGTLTLRPDGSFDYVPDADYAGSDGFTYVANNSVDSDVTQVTIEIRAVYDEPRPTVDGFSTAIGWPLIVDIANGVLANDGNPDQADLTVSLDQDALHGDLLLNSDGSLTYQGDEGFVGLDGFSYRIHDGTTVSEAIPVELFVSDRPVVISEVVAANGNSLRTRTRQVNTEPFEGSAQDPDWIEIRNLTGTEQDVGGMWLTDDASQPQQWQIPLGTTIPARGFLMLFASGEDITDVSLDELGYMHTSFKLNHGGEHVSLHHSDGQVAHSYAPGIPPLRGDLSFGLSGGVLAYLREATPGKPNTLRYEGTVGDPLFSETRGFFSEPFQVSITAPTPGATIVYTVDGSDPTLGGGMAVPADGPSELPQTTVEITTTTTLRAATILADHLPSNVGTQTYLFLEDVLQQPALPDGVPDTWNNFLIGPVGQPVPADYELDPRIVDDPDYSDTLIDDLLSLPTLSLVMDGDDWFGTTEGIYTNPFGTGPDWERTVSAEWIDPEGDQLQFGAGIRVFGGWSRHFNASPKKSFTLRFQDQHGPTRLDFPLFEDSSVDNFNLVVLRAVFSDAWPDAASPPQYLRDLFARQTQLEMGQPASRGAWVHLYINGLYWGIYNPSERPDASFAASHFGGEPEQYDAVKHLSLLGPGRVVNNSYEVVDGDDEAWLEVLSLAQNDLLNEPANYTRFQELVDVENLADYIILNHYVSNVDWPHKNWWANRGREPGGKFRFYAWDSEYTLRIGDVSADRLAVNNPNTPAQLYIAARSNPDFARMFGDRVHQHLFNDGVLQPAANIARYEALAEEIESAIVAESARWGDNSFTRKGITFFTKNDHWLPQRDVIVNPENGFFVRRHDLALDHFRNAGLYPRVDAPSFDQHGGYVPWGFELAVTAHASAGATYFTTDGSDPRHGGRLLRGPIRLHDSAVVQARTLVDGEWSALNRAEFLVGVVPANGNNLRISEVHYHPADPSTDEIQAGHTDGDDFEFLEIVNVGPQPIDLSDVSLAQVDGEGVAFAFADASVQLLAPGERAVVVEDAAAFSTRYGDGQPVAGVWSGRLSNNRELLTLRNSSEIIQQFRYDDDWHPDTDGDGPSLEFLDPTVGNLALWNQAAGWRPSAQIGGTPGTGEPINLPGDFDADDDTDAEDIDRLLAEVQAGTHTPSLDLTGDGQVDDQDLQTLVRGILSTQPGDTNLDGVVTAADDGQMLLANLGLRDLGWAGGDFDGDGRVSASLDGAALLAALAGDASQSRVARTSLVDLALAESAYRLSKSTWND